MKTMIEIELKSIMQNHNNPQQYEVCLTEVKGEREFAFVINQSKGKALIMALDLKKPNVAVHNLYINTLQKVNMQFNKVNIVNYDNGEFETQLVLKRDDFSMLPIQCNIYDALIFSMITFCPIYIEENTFDIVVDEYKQHKKTIPKNNIFAPENLPKDSLEYQQIKTPYLEKMLSLAIQKEEYEKAMAIRDELQKRKEQKL